MGEQRAVLAMYDFRSKQQYIYRTHQLREIIGASRLITAAYDRFMNALEEQGIFVEKNYRFASSRYVNDEDASADALSVFTDGVRGRVLNIGGGTLYVLWDSRETCQSAGAVLCDLLRREAYGLCPVCGAVGYTGDYARDMKALRASFEACKAGLPPMVGPASLPFTELDRKTSLPITQKRHGRSLSRESALKLAEFRRYVGEGENRKDVLAIGDLDSLVEEKGRESLLAVIYVDGNGMGERVGRLVGQEQSYGKLVPALRRFSNAIQQNYVTRPIEAIRAWALEDAKNRACRLVVAGGDEMTIICNARHALAIVSLYFDALKESGPENTACAGICVFHSHFPFSTAYEMAEACCENAKKRNRLAGDGAAHNLVDFQFLYGAVNGDLETLRSADGRFMDRPYSMDAGDGFPKLADFSLRAERLGSAEGPGRGNIKNLAELLLRDDDSYDMEVERLNARYSERVQPEDRAMMLDISQFYDIWFADRQARLLKKEGD